MGSRRSKFYIQYIKFLEVGFGKTTTHNKEMNQCKKEIVKISTFLLQIFYIDNKIRSMKDNFRRQGHGEALLKAAIQKCRTRHIQPLYQKLGFKIDRLIEGYYSLTRDAYVMYECWNKGIQLKTN
ncbi:hypothetical protein MKW98_014855 [Papaver atlanticum]|uniref:N-acetyltransferase domain-containing protein n=1 Tax=Papaver atlanticum TaxID=357466 RepID=A0AAD4SFQ6_9MAGN|nr:hypothetical protein MKW98_014855 [Papaver atlanticum]